MRWHVSPICTLLVTRYLPLTNNVRTKSTCVIDDKKVATCFFSTYFVIDENREGEHEIGTSRETHQIEECHNLFNTNYTLLTFTIIKSHTHKTSYF